MPKKGEKIIAVKRTCKRCNNKFLGRPPASVCPTCYYTCPRCNGLKKDRYGKMCLSCKYELHGKKFSGEKGTNWRGGKNKIPYGPGWNDNRKNKIRKRDNYLCQICGLHQNKEIGGLKLQVHHIDFSKDNHSHSNLITLCRKCHTSIHRIYEDLVKDLIKKSRKGK